MFQNLQRTKLSEKIEKQFLFDHSDPNYFLINQTACEFSGSREDESEMRLYYRGTQTHYGDEKVKLLVPF